MNLKLKDIQSVCNKVSSVLCTDDTNMLTSIIEIIIENKVAKFKVMSSEYIVTISLDIDSDEVLHASVSANVFIKLISQITTSYVEILQKDNFLIIKSNGMYKLPLEYIDDELASIPEFTINNIQNRFSLSTYSLKNILNINSKELTKGSAVNPVQKMYYIDSKGCITFTTGACITHFSIPEGINILLTGKLVNTFKILDSETVDVVYGKDILNNSIEQNKIILSTESSKIEAYLNFDSSLVNNVPKDIIRNMEDSTPPYHVKIDANELLSAINRLLIFMPSSLYSQPCGKLTFDGDKIKIYDRLNINVEELKISKSISLPNDVVSVIVDFNDIKLSLESIRDKEIDLYFGNEKLIIIKSSYATNIIPECVE